MKNKLFRIATVAALLSLSPGLQSFTGNENKTPVAAKLKAAIKWKTTEIDLGEIPQSKPVTLNYEFTNTGDTPVIISGVQVSCGCTVADYAKTPVLPGESTIVKATFNAASKGAFKKNLTVTTNADEMPVTLTFHGTVI